MTEKSSKVNTERDRQEDLLGENWVVVATHRIRRIKDIVGLIKFNHP